LGREIIPPPGKAFSIPGLEMVDQRTLELEFHSLEGFIQLGRNLERIFLHSQVSVSDSASESKKINEI